MSNDDEQRSDVRIPQADRAGVQSVRVARSPQVTHWTWKDQS
jgi:hypothetical protein